MKTAVQGALFCTLILCVGATLAAVTHYPAPIFGGDFIHPHLLLLDFVNGGSLYEWRSSAALYAFPDWLLASTILLPMEAPSAVLLSSLLLWISVCLAGGLLSSQVTGRGFLAASVSYTSLLVISAWLSGQSVLSWLYAFSGTLYIHTGAAFVAMLCAAFFLMCVGSFRWWIFACLVVATMLTTYSDPLFFIWLCAPVAASSVLVSVRFRNPKVLPLGLSVLAAGAVALFAESKKPFPSAGRDILVGTRQESLRVVGEVLSRSLSKWDPLVLVMLIIILVALAVALHSLVVGRGEKRVAATTLLIAMTGAVLSAPLALGLIRDEASLRYMIAIVPILPVLVLVSSPRWVWPAAAIPALALASVSFLNSYDQISLRIRAASLQPIMECLQKNRLRDGLAGYGYAKPLILLSRGSIHIEQVGQHAPTNFTSRFRNERLDGTPFSPNFLIISSDVPPDYAAATFGEPLHRLQCAGVEILQYGSEISRARVRVD